MIHKPRKVSKAMRNSNGEIYFIDITEKYLKKISPENKHPKFYDYLYNSFGLKNIEILKNLDERIIQNKVITEKDLLELIRFIY
jgi:hypothetical protein